MDGRRISQVQRHQISKDKMALQRLKEKAEKAKIALSHLQETSVNLPLLAVGPGGPVHLDLRLSRATLEQMMQPLVDRTREPVKKALADGKRSVGEIQEVVLVGGSTRIPMVKKAVKKVLRQGPAPGRESGRAGSGVARPSRRASSWAT